MPAEGQYSPISSVWEGGDVELLETMLSFYSSIVPEPILDATYNKGRFWKGIIYLITQRQPLPHDWPGRVLRAPPISVQDFGVVDLPPAVSARVDALFVDDRTRWGGPEEDLGDLFSCRVYPRRVRTNRSA